MAKYFTAALAIVSILLVGVLSRQDFAPREASEDVAAPKARLVVVPEARLVAAVEEMARRHLDSEGRVTFPPGVIAFGTGTGYRVHGVLLEQESDDSQTSYEYCVVVNVTESGFEQESVVLTRSRQPTQDTETVTIPPTEDPWDD